MRHLIILAAATLALSVLTGVAYHLDRSRIDNRRAALEQQIGQELAGFEQRYLGSALTLLATKDANRDFVTEVREEQQALNTTSDWRQRAPLFESLVNRIRPQVLATVPSELGTDPQSQELRRLQDEMNGALHRRNVLLERVSSPRQRQVP